MEINRIEADRHLIGVGRELQSLDGKAKATLPVHVTEDGYTYQTTYFCGLHNFCVAARGICNDFETNIPGERTNDSAGVA